MDSTSRMAMALLAVLCFFDCLAIQEELITFGMGMINFRDFPTNRDSYTAAIKFLVASNRVSFQKRPNRFFVITDAIKSTVIQGLGMDERIATFNTAVSLLSAYWPWLTTFNATDVERLNIVRKYRSHITALRNVCLDFEPDGFVPGLGFCALLHEEAHLGTMQNTVLDMHLDCAEYGLPLADRILLHHRDAETDPARKDEYERLLMNQTRFVGITASMIGKAEKAASMMHIWMMRFLLDRILLRSRPEDKRTLAFAYVENGLCKLRCADPDVSEADTNFELAIKSHGLKKGVGKDAFKFLFPQVVRALFLMHYRRFVALAVSAIDDLLSERGQRRGLIFDDLTSLETGIILFAKGTITYFGGTNGLRDNNSVKEALSFLKRAVYALQKTHGREALWTLAATYRMAVCLFDLGRYDEAIFHLDTVNRAFHGYNREFSEHDGSDILWQKARALWKGGRTLLALDSDAYELEANDMIDEALKIHWDICGTFAHEASITDANWDDMVFFLYR